MKAPNARDFAMLLDRFEKLEKRILKLEKAKEKPAKK
jgi:uncharacterized protein YdcH (DUF465 family)